MSLATKPGSTSTHCPLAPLTLQVAPMKRFRPFGLAATAAVLVLVLKSVGVEAQVGDPATLDQEKLVSQIKLTKPTADHTDVVTAGDVVLLHKDGLMMCSSASPYAFSNTYANGVLAANYNNRAKDAAKSFLRGRIPFGGGGSAADAANNGCASRKFVAGEKFFVTGAVVQKDGIVVSTISDPYNDVRFYGEIKFLFPKGSVPGPDDFIKTVSELITVQPADDKDQAQGNQGNQNNQGQSTQAAGPAAAPAPAAPLAPIAPPPPPPDQPAATPKTISIGQTKDVVIGTWGQPTKDIKLSNKEILVYPDMKVTLVAGKVSDVQ
jgi:hypothetical protein